MFAIAAEHPVLAALVVLLAGWIIRVVRKGYVVRKTFHNQVCCVTDVGLSGSRRLTVHRSVHRTHGFGVTLK